MADVADSQDVFRGVIEALGRNVGADAAWLIQFRSNEYTTNLGVWSTRELSLPVGTSQVIGDELREVRESRRPYRVDVAELDPTSAFALEARRSGIVSAVGVPVFLTTGQVWALAVVARFGPERFPPDTEIQMTNFIEPVTGALVTAGTTVEPEDWTRQHAALRRLIDLAATDLHRDKLLQAVVIEASALLDGRTVILARVEADRLIGSIVAVSDDSLPVGLRFSTASDNPAARVLRSGRPERIDDYTRYLGEAIAEELGVRAVVAVPLGVEDELWGILAATSVDEPLPAGTETRLSHFAEIAIGAISSAHTRGELQRIADEQAALLRVAKLVARGADENELFNAVAVEAAGLIGNAGTSLVRFDGPRTYAVIATSGGPAELGRSVEVPQDDPYIVGEVIRTHRPARRDDYQIPKVPQLCEREYGPGSNVVVPIIVEGRLWGLLSSVTEGRRLPPETEGRLQQFAELVAAAIANAQARAEVQLLADEQSALLRVAELVAHGAREEDLFDAVTVEAAGLINNEATTLIRYEGGRTFTVLATRQGPAEAGAVFSVPADDVGTISEMLRTGLAARLDSDEAAPSWTFSQDRYKVGSSVSVPIVVEGRLWGSLGTLITLTEGRRLPQNTRARLQKFGELVAAAIANSQARTEVILLADEQAALRRVAELVARDASLQEVFTGITIEASRLLAVGTALLRFEPDGYAKIVATHNGDARLGLRIPITDSHIGRMFVSGQAKRLADYLDIGFAAAVKDLGLQPGTAVPITVEGTIWGALKTSPSGAALPAGAEEKQVSRVADKLDKFAALASAAIANAENRAQLTASRARIVATADETRRRLQRDVHDGAQQRLVQTVLTLKLARQAAEAGEPTDDLVEEALQYAERATAELRDLVHGILPASLSRGGLRSGIESLIADLPVSVQLSFSAPRLPSKMEITAYFIVAEALTNVVKHAEATRASVSIGFHAGRVTIEVRDDGCGGVDVTRGSGLTGLLDRVETAEGTLSIVSPPGAGTILEASLPVRWL